MQQQLNELTDLCTMLQRQQDEMASKITDQDLEISQLKAWVKLLEDRDGGGIAQSGKDAPIKGRSLDEGDKAAIQRSIEKGSNNTEEMVNILTSLDAATVLSSGVSVSISPVTEVSVAEVPTSSGSIPTASPLVLEFLLVVFPLVVVLCPLLAQYLTPLLWLLPTQEGKVKKRWLSQIPKKKKIQEQIDVHMARQLEEEMERDAQRMNEQIARDAEIVRIHAKEELQIMIDGLDRNNETVAKYLQKYYQFAGDLPIREKIELISNLVKYQDNYAKVLKYQIRQRKPFSRKQQKEFYMSVLKSHAEEVPEENLKEMMQLISVKEIYVEALQVKHPIIDWEVHTEGQRTYWKIIRLGGSSASYQFFVDFLKHFDREDLNQLWALVKETLNIRPATSDKEKELWLELKRLYEPDVEDLLLQKLISQLEIHGESISQEDLNLNLLRSLPSEWKTHTLIWRNKLDLEILSMDDLYNNLKIYETEVKRKSSSSQNSQNVAFLSSNSSSSTNQAHGSNSANIDSLSDAVIYSVFVNQSNSPQLDNEDLQQIDADDLEEMDLKWQMPMLTIRARRFLKKTRRKVGGNGSKTIGFGKTKMECYNYHKRGHFVRECMAPRKNWNKEPVRRNVTVETTDANALVAQDRFGSSSSDSKVNDKYKTSEGYHAVPHPYTGNFMPPKPNLILADVDEYGVSESINSVPTIATNEAKTSKSKPKSEKGVIDSRCSRHMTRNMSYLSEYEEINDGYVAFGGDPKGDTECVVLSPDFKLLNESQVLLRVPRKNNMYSVDLKNVATSGGLTCLFVKATLDESNIWHRRLGHINYKTMNKLVKGNLVRGLTSKMFENDHTCVACQKGKQHKASWNQSNGSACKAKVETVPDKDYLLLPLWTQDLLFFSSSKDSPGDGFKPSGEEEKKDVEDLGNEDNEVLTTEEPRFNQEKDANVNNTNNINTISPTLNAASTKDNAVDENIVYGCADDLNMHNLEEIVYSDNDKYVSAEVDITNLDTNIPVSPILTTRIYKDHLVEQIFGDIHSAPQTRRMKKNVTNHTSLALVDLPNGKRAIGTKEIYINKKDERGIMVVLAYASFKDFVMYQMDMKSAFLYGIIKEEVYVCQPLGFEDPEFLDRVSKVEKALYGIDQALRAWPDIMFGVCAFAIFQITPKVSHLHVVKRISRYLKGQPKLGLWYPKDSPFDLEAYTNRDYVGASLDRKSTTGDCQFLRRRLISWQCKKQTVVANATTKA
nr:ribonuclease H-like domain-containing protein [Tanacetum cinerariifolium]